MSLMIKAIPGAAKLSELEVDVDKDWGGHRIENLGAPDSNDDAARQDVREDETLPLTLETRTSDPGSPEDGRIWLRTDL